MISNILRLVYHVLVPNQRFPRVFSFPSSLLRRHARAHIERLGGKVLIVEGKRDNIKLTVPEDYVLLASAVRTMLLNSEHR